MLYSQGIDTSTQLSKTKEISYYLAKGARAREREQQHLLRIKSDSIIIDNQDTIINVQKKIITKQAATNKKLNIWNQILKGLVIGLGCLALI